MANSMPFNSVNSDRVYKAEDWAWYFSTFIKNGVFPDPSDGLKVVADTGMNLKVKPGFAFIHGYAMRNPDEFTITIDTADGAMKRIDRVVVRLDHVGRDMYIHMLKGTASDRPVAPDITRDAEIHDIVLADIMVGNGVTSISNSAITDMRFDSHYCGIVTGTVEEIDPSTLTLQFETYFNEFKTNFEQDMDVWKNQQQADLEDWLQELYGKISADEIANTLQQVEELKKKPSPLWVDGKTLVVDGEKIRADQPYINAPTATTSWKLSSHTKAGVYAFKILAGASSKPQDAPSWLTGSNTDFCMEVVPFNGEGTNSKGCVLQRLSSKDRVSMRFIDVGAVEAGGNPGEWKDISLPENMESRITKLEGRNISFAASSGISGNQYIPIGRLKSSGAGNGAVYGILMDINVYTRIASGGFGFSNIRISMSNTGGNFTVYSNFDRNPQGFDIEAYLSDDGSFYDLYIRTNYGGTKGSISYYTNAPDDVSILVGTPTAAQPAGVSSGSFSLYSVPYITREERDKWNGYASEIAKKAEVTTQNFEVYVSPTGNDISGDGSSAKPFQTISRALLEKAEKAGYHKCTVKVAAGDYSNATGLYLDSAIRASNVYAEIQLQGDVTFKSNGEFVIDIDNSTISVTGTDKVINLTGSANSGQIYVHNDGNITMYGPVIKFNGGGAGKGILATSGGIFSQALGRTSMDNLEDAAEASVNGRIYLESVFGGGNTNGFVASSGGQIAYGTSTMTATNNTVTSKGGRILTGTQ